MSLVGFHRALIIVAIAFCFVYAGWEVRAWLDGGARGTIVIAGIFALLGLGLTVYLARLASILRLKE